MRIGGVVIFISTSILGLELILIKGGLPEKRRGAFKTSDVVLILEKLL